MAVFSPSRAIPVHLLATHAWLHRIHPLPYIHRRFGSQTLGSSVWASAFLLHACKLRYFISTLRQPSLSMSYSHLRGGLRLVAVLSCTAVMSALIPATSLSSRFLARLAFSAFPRPSPTREQLDLAQMGSPKETLGRSLLQKLLSPRSPPKTAQEPKIPCVSPTPCHGDQLGSFRVSRRRSPYQSGFEDWRYILELFIGGICD